MKVKNATIIWNENKDNSLEMNEKLVAAGWKKDFPFAANEMNWLINYITDNINKLSQKQIEFSENEKPYFELYRDDKVIRAKLPFEVKGFIEGNKITLELTYNSKFEFLDEIEDFTTYKIRINNLPKSQYNNQIPDFNFGKLYYKNTSDIVNFSGYGMEISEGTLDIFKTITDTKEIILNTDDIKPGNNINFNFRISYLYYTQ